MSRLARPPPRCCMRLKGSPTARRASLATPMYRWVLKLHFRMRLHHVRCMSCIVFQHSGTRSMIEPFDLGVRVHSLVVHARPLPPLPSPSAKSRVQTAFRLCTTIFLFFYFFILPPLRDVTGTGNGNRNKLGTQRSNLFRERFPEQKTECRRLVHSVQSIPPTGCQLAMRCRRLLRGQPVSGTMCVPTNMFAGLRWRVSVALTAPAKLRRTSTQLCSSTQSAVKYRQASGKCWKGIRRGNKEHPHTLFLLCRQLLRQQTTGQVSPQVALHQVFRIGLPTQPSSMVQATNF